MIGLMFSIFAALAAPYGPELEGEFVSTDPGIAGDTGLVGCSDQYLVDGEQLPDLPLFYNRMNPNLEWGTPLMIDTIIDATRHMRWLMPDASPVGVGDISSQRGGVQNGHKSHRGGIDADIGIYSTGGYQNPRSFDDPGANLDVEATWALVSALLDTGNVEFILLDQGHINRLRSYVLTNGLLSEAEAAAIFPSGSYWGNTGFLRHAPSHRDHLHVRVLCGDGTRGR